MKKNIDCLVLGDAFFDVTAVLQNKRNLATTGGTTICKYMLLSPGGAANVAVTLSRLGGRSAFCGMVGNDLLSHIYYQDLKKNRVLPIIFKSDNKSTGILSTFVLPNGQRSFLVSRGANSNLKHHHIDKVFRKVNPKILYISGHSLADKLIQNAVIRAAKIARSKGITIMFACTPHNLVKLKHHIFLKFLKMTDCLCLNLEEARALTDEMKTKLIIRKLIPRVKLITLTLGRNGCIIADKNQVVRINAPKVKVVDTTGAGDAFAAAIAFGIAKNLSNEKMAKMAVLMGSLTVQHLGPRTPKKTKITHFVGTKKKSIH